MSFFLTPLSQIPCSVRSFEVFGPHETEISDFSLKANQEKMVVMEGLREIEKYTCIRFVQRTFQNDFVLVFNGQGCYSALGRNGGRQTLSLNRNGCVYKGTVMHEFIHALGYHHM